MLVSWRGEDGRDAPEHLVMGRIMAPFLELLHVPFEVFDPGRIESQVGTLTGTLRATRRPVALVVPKACLEQ
jgi:phosphonopyruvate decarboxylase